MRAYVEQFLKQRQLTLAELSGRLGYKSKTSLERLMDANVRTSSVLDFERRMVAAFPLEGAELSQLRNAVDLKRSGPDIHRANQEWWELLHGTTPWPHEPLTLTDLENGCQVTLVQRYGAVENLRITLLGCVEQALYPDLAALLQREDVTVRHYIRATGDSARLVRALRAVMPILHNPRYSLYVRPGKPAMEERETALWANLLYASYTVDGHPREDLAVFHSPVTGALTCRDGGVDRYERLLGLDLGCYLPCKRHFQSENALNELIDYAAAYEQLEHDRSIWMLKNDLSSNYIPGDLLIRAALEGGVPREAVGPMAQICQERFYNTYSKKKHVYTVFQQEAMRAFVETGVTSDHFYAMRPFTPAERVQILTQVRGHMRSNSYFHIYFLREEEHLQAMDLTCYQGEGILLMTGDSHFDLSQPHAETLLGQDSLTAMFPSFFQDVLIRYCCLDEAGSLQVLDQLLSRAEALAAGKA